MSIVTPKTVDNGLTNDEPLSVSMDLNTDSVSGDLVDRNMPSDSVSVKAPETDVRPVARGKYKRFSYREKLSVKEFPKQHGIRAAAKHFKIPKFTVNNWCKTDYNNDNLRNHKTGDIQKSGRPLSYEEDIDMMILAYVSF